jgi:hypothetical protein
MDPIAISAQFLQRFIRGLDYVKGFLALGADQLRDTRGDPDNLPTDLHPSQVLGPVDGALKSVEDCLRRRAARRGGGKRSGLQ